MAEQLCTVLKWCVLFRCCLIFRGVKIAGYTTNAFRNLKRLIAILEAREEHTKVQSELVESDLIKLFNFLLVKRTIKSQDCRVVHLEHANRQLDQLDEDEHLNANGEEGSKLGVVRRLSLVIYRNVMPQHVAR